MNLSGDFVTIFLNLLFIMGTLAISISFHEAAHAWTALRLGDPTAKHQGRVSLNPFDHIDPIGTVILPLFMMISGLPVFGWAKPTPFNPWNLENPKRDSALISLAGPASNLAIAIIVSFVYRIFPSPYLVGIIQLNLTLCFFNLIPIHPLDGAKIVGGMLPKDLYYQWMSLERYGPLLLLFLVFFGGGLISAVLGPIMLTTLHFLGVN